VSFLPHIILSVFLLGFSTGPNHLVERGTYFYILEKKAVAQGTFRLYVEEIHDQGRAGKGEHYWLTYDPQAPRFELYDNTWFDRFLKPTDRPERAQVGRMVIPTSVRLSPNRWQSLRHRKGLYTYYPNEASVPKSNMNVPMKATDFNRCQPSTTPPQHKNGEPCADRGQAAHLPPFLWQAIVEALNEDKDLKLYYQNGLITPPMVAAAAHLETRFAPLTENRHEKELCLKGECTPYRWGKGPGQVGASESLSLWNIHWKAPNNHHHVFVRNFESIAKKNLGSCGLAPDLRPDCHQRFKRHMAHCRRYEKLNNGTSHSFCFKPAFRMFAKKMRMAFDENSIVWRQSFDGQSYQLHREKILDIVNRDAGGDPELWFATNARLRAGYINRGAMVNLSLQECVNTPGDISCNYGNLSNKISRRPSSTTSLGTPEKSLGAQILKGEFINRCHVWYFSGLCGPVRKGSLLEQYTTHYEKKIGALPQPNPKAI
jgi:hypothetical protein